MGIKQCINRHFFDEDKYDECPYCNVNKLLEDMPLRFRNLGSVTFCSSGVTSKVYKISGGHDYALKVVECGDSESKYENALHEVRILKKLGGEPRVIQLCDYETVDTGYSKTVYILEEFHSSLSEYLLSRSFRITDILSLLIGICDSLLACMEHGVLHLDVQPGNIYVDDPFGVKIGDFSHSMFADDVQSNHGPRGTLAYMAPEVYQSGCCSERSDLYSLGLILYALFNNRVLPFMESDSPELAGYKRLAGTRIPGISLKNQAVQNELNRIINKACSYFAADRYSGLNDLKDDLESLLKAVAADDEKNLEIIYKGNDLQKRVMSRGHVLQTAGLMSDTDSASTLIDPTASTGALFDADPVAATSAFFDVDPVATTSTFFDADPVATTAALYDSKSPTDNPAVDIKKVEFSAIAPKQLMRGDYSIISVVMYEKTSRYIVESIIKEIDEPAQEKRSGILDVKVDSQIRVVLTSPDIEIDDNEETGIWKGEHLVFSFAIMLPEEYKKRQLLFTAFIYINDVVASKLKFFVKCSSLVEQKITVSRKDIYSAFVSYASQDRKRVAAIVQGIQKARPDLDVFFDIESLRSGEDWERALFREIDRRDILYLCWSHFASESEWVDKEWRYALDQKGAEAIEPIPIEAPEDCPPPIELSAKHFNDKLLYLMNTANTLKISD